MWTKSHNIEIILLYLLSLIPWQGPNLLKISCPREGARVVRKIVQSKWTPILDKYNVKLPIECPFHPARDIYAHQQSAKIQNRPSQWSCGFCGKHFYEEKYLDMHFDNRHMNHINTAEDAVCFSDYCDIMRCDVLIAQDASLSFGEMKNTDIEVWSQSNAYRSAINEHLNRDIPAFHDHSDPTSKADNVHSCHDKTKCDIKISENSEPKITKAKPISQSIKLNKSAKKFSSSFDTNKRLCDKNKTAFCMNTDNVNKKELRMAEFKKLKANCIPTDLQKLRIQCEILVRNCVGGLLMNLSTENFRSMEEELTRTVCWYLTCDRYWENIPSSPRAFPWILLFVIILILSFGLCLCYYIIWVFFDTDDHLNSPGGSSTQQIYSSPLQQYYSPSHRSLINESQIGKTYYNVSPLATTHLTTAPSTSSTIGGGSLPIKSNVMQQMYISQAQSHSQSEFNLASRRIPTLTAPSASAGNLNTLSEIDPNFSLAAGDEVPNEIGQSEHYIYVTYPPELKRRLLESCYNRTTRL